MVIINNPNLGKKTLNKHQRGVLDDIRCQQGMGYQDSLIVLSHKLDRTILSYADIYATEFDQAKNALRINQEYHNVAGVRRVKI